MALPTLRTPSELAPADAHVGAFLAAVRVFFDQAHQDALGVVDESLSEQRGIVETLGEQNRVLQVQVAQLEAARKEALTAHTAAESALKAENEALHQQLEQMRAERDVLRERVKELEPHCIVTKALEGLLAQLLPNRFFPWTTTQLKSRLAMVHHPGDVSQHIQMTLPTWVRELIKENLRK